MKIAGQKNDGAWFRANKFLSNLGVAGQAALSAKLIPDTGVIAMYSAAAEIAGLAGYAELPDSLASVTDWVNTLVNVGIPRQVWMGVLTWDTYSYDTNVPPRLVPDHAGVWRIGAHNIRKIVTRFRLERRQLLDFAQEVGADEGNPGGIADADIET